MITYVVLGGNAAGMSFAAKMRRNEPENKIIVIEKRDYVSFGGCGLPYYVGDNFSNSNDMIVRTPDEFIKSGIDLRILESATQVDKENKIIHILKKDNTTYELRYDKLIISTGANPIVIGSTPRDSKKIFTLTTKEDGELLKEVVTNNKDKIFGIIGTGFIGIEVLNELKHLNIKTKVYSRSNSILDTQFSNEMTENVYQELIQDNNVDINLGVGISDITLENDSVLVHYDKTIDRVDYLIQAVGVRPNTDFIDLKKLGNGAIVTDEFSRAYEDIFAIGDCATVYNPILKKPSFIALATTANKAGRALADRLAGNEVHFPGMIGSSSVKILDYEMARTGLSEKECIDNDIDYKTKIIKDFDHTSYVPGREEIKAKIIYEKDTLIILGIEMIGKNGIIPRVDVMALAILKELTTKELGYIDFCYSPPFARTWEFLNVVGNVSK